MVNVSIQGKFTTQIQKNKQVEDPQTNSSSNIINPLQFRKKIKKHV